MLGGATVLFAAYSVYRKFFVQAMLIPQVRPPRLQCSGLSLWTNFCAFLSQFQTVYFSLLGGATVLLAANTAF